MSKLCKDCAHRRPANGWCEVNKKHVPKKTDKQGNVTTCDQWAQKRKHQQ